MLTGYADLGHKEVMAILSYSTLLINFNLFWLCCSFQSSTNYVCLNYMWFYQNLNKSLGSILLLLCMVFSFFCATWLVMVSGYFVGLGRY